MDINILGYNDDDHVDNHDYRDDHSNCRDDRDGCHSVDGDDHCDPIHDDYASDDRYNVVGAFPGIGPARCCLPLASLVVKRDQQTMRPPK